MDYSEINGYDHRVATETLTGRFMKTDAKHPHHLGDLMAGLIPPIGDPDKDLNPENQASMMVTWISGRKRNVPIAWENVMEKPLV